ncbi:hypothetical protein ACTXT7_011714 [Hymenolepis weldensis]
MGLEVNSYSTVVILYHNRKITRARWKKVSSNEQVKGYFQQFGIVENILIKWKDPGCFAVFSSISEAHKTPTASIHSVSCRSCDSGPGRKKGK